MVKQAEHSMNDIKNTSKVIANQDLPNYADQYRNENHSYSRLENGL